VLSHLELWQHFKSVFLSLVLGQIELTKVQNASLGFEIIYTCVCMCIYVYICICIYIYIHTHTGSAKKMYTHFNERKLYVV